MIINKNILIVVFLFLNSYTPIALSMGSEISAPSTIIRKPFYFLRHGQTNLNLEERHQGQLDTELNEAGIQQAEQAALILSSHQIKSICSSPLKRAKQTTEIISRNRTCTIRYLEGLKDRYKGKAEGLLYKEFEFDNTFIPLSDEELILLPFGRHFKFEV